MFHSEFSREQTEKISASGVSCSLRLLEFGKGNAPSKRPGTELDVTEAYSLLFQTMKMNKTIKHGTIGGAQNSAISLM